MKTTRRCPDCGIRKEETKMRTDNGFELHLVTDEPRPGILGGLRAGEKTGMIVVVCPECGLIRKYADR